MFKNHYEILMAPQHFTAKFPKIGIGKIVKGIAAHKAATYVVEDNDLLLCDTVHSALVMNKSIQELIFRKNLSPVHLKALCALMDSNITILKISGTLGGEADYLSACLTLNDTMRRVDIDDIIDPAANEIIIENPRFLLFEEYCNALINHVAVTRIVIKASLTLLQLSQLNGILKRNSHIDTVIINNLDASKSVNNAPKQGAQGIESESAILRNTLTFNQNLAQVRSGSREKVRVDTSWLSSEQIAAVTECFRQGNLVKVLECSEVNEALLQGLPVDGSLTQLRIACRLDREANAQQYRLLQQFLATNISVHEIVHHDYDNELKESLIKNAYRDDKCIRQLRVNIFYHSLIARKSLSLEMQRLSITDQKMQFITRRLANMGQIHHVRIEACVFTESGLLEILNMLENNPALNLKSLTLQNMPISQPHFSAIMNIVKSHPFLINLQMINVGLTDAEIPLLAEALKSNVQLSVLNLHGNKIGNQGVTILCGALETNRRISALYIGGNPFDSTGVAAVKLLLAKTAYITTVSLESSTLKEADVKPFIDAISKTNISLIDLRLSHHTEQNRHFAHGFNASPNITAYKKPEMDRIQKFVTANTGKRDELFISVRQGKVDVVTKALSYKVSPLCADSDGNTALHVALLQNPVSIPMVECLIRGGSHLLLMNKAGKIPAELLGDGAPPDLRILLQTAQQNFIEHRELPMLVVEPVHKKAKVAGPLDKMFSAAKKVAQSPVAVYAVAPADPNSVDVAVNYQQSAYFSALNNNAILLQNCVRKMDLAHIYPDGNTLWHLAAAKSALDCLHVLSANMQPAHMRNLFLQFPLHLICLNILGHVSLAVLQIIIKANPDAVNALDYFGRTPLFCLTGGFDLQNLVVEADGDRALAAKILLENSASPNCVVDDLNNQRMQCSVLQKCIELGYYRLAKVLIASTHCNLMHVDSAGWSVVHYAVHYGRVDLLARLLIQPQVNLDITNRDGRTARQMLLDNQFAKSVKDSGLLRNQMELLFESRSKIRMPGISSELHWVKNLVVRYGSRHGRNQDLVISFKEEHAALLNAARPHLQNPGNWMSASLTFIISQGAHKSGAQLPRIAIKINMPFKPSVHATDAWRSVASIENPDDVSTFKIRKKRSPDAVERIIARFEAAPEDMKKRAVADIKQDRLPLTPAGIDALFKTVGEVPNQDNFEQRFHHSEHALFDHLQQPEVIRSILEKLQADPHFERGTKVVAIILNGFSKNYVCPDCAITTMGFQNTQEGAFFKSLTEQLVSIGCVLPKMSKLRAITLFSAQQPYRQPRKSADEHEELAIDLRAYQNNLVLSQDVTVITPSITMFTSRK